MDFWTVKNISGEKTLAKHFTLGISYVEHCWNNIKDVVL